ncbi:MAG: gamma-glutamylcyclotransferase family protein [Burkholderiales bacterium]|nr:gamma-glutamylcyclotransferase family protein [Burkholderiales bacterium]
MRESLLFVYGTLRRALRHEMHRVLQRAAAFVGTATVRGTLYDLGAYPGLVAAADSDDLVTGEVYRLERNRAGETLAALDAYEGCTAADPEPHEYRRRVVPARLADGSERAAWTYVLNRSPAGLERIPHGDYLAWRRRGGAR